MSATTPADRLARAIEATDQLIAGVGDDQWTSTTPCSEWSVRQLVNHVVFGNQMFADLLSGDPPSPEDLARRRGLDHLGDDPVGAFRTASAALQTAFGQPDVLEHVFQSPVGPAPGAVLLHMRTVEMLVHGWDLAQATGQSPDLPDDLAEEELTFTRRMLGENVPRSGRFGEPQPAPAAAPAVTRLAAFLGRSLAPEASAT